MAGLLDFAQTPAGQGLLSGIASYMMNARRGTPVNNVGRGLAGGLMGYTGAIDAGKAEEEKAFNQQFRQMQMTEMQAKMDDAKRLREAAAKKQELFQSLAPKYSKPVYEPSQVDDPFNQGPTAFGELYGGAEHGNVLPTGNYTQTGSKLDLNALVSAMPNEMAQAGYVDEAMAMMPKVEDYTLAPGAKRYRGNQPLAENPVAEKFDPNKPFLMVDGKIIPNKDYQKYELEKAEKGSVRVNQSVGMPKLQTEEQKEKGKYNVGSLYTDIANEGRVARKLNASLDTMSKYVGATGWGTQAKTYGASILGALGVADAEQYAGDAQKFNAAAKEVVLQKQLAQKGPQTESDAKRIEQTGAQLGNTPRANEFIIDVARAQNDQSIKYHNFMDEYWRKNGTYEGAENVWYSGEGGKSIFDTPRLKKYGIINNKPQAGQSKTKIFKLDGGGSVTGTLDADGNYYTMRNNKRYRVEE